MATSSGPDYKTAIWAYYRYYPSLAAAIAFIVLFSVSTFLHLFQMIRTRTWFFIPFVIGVEWVGYIGRALSSHESPSWTLGPYLIQTLLLLLAPAFFAASIYMMLGKIIICLDGEQHSILRQRWLTKVFVCGDILSFTVQAAGGGMMTGGSLSGMHTGEKVVIVGLIIQILFFGLFIITAAIFNYRIGKSPTGRSMTGNVPWRKHLHALYAANALIMIRSVFRVIEYAMGNNGYILRHEAFLYIFDGLLMLMVMVIFNVVHPNEIKAALPVGEKLKTRSGCFASGGKIGFELYRYTHSVLAAVIFIVLFVLATTYHFYQLIRNNSCRHQANYSVIQVVQIVGHVARAAAHSNIERVPIYSIKTILSRNLILKGKKYH
ncbi:protein RTM1 [Penicillium canescens]|nr:protein RTM1 [Penicillium canescens]